MGKLQPKPATPLPVSKPDYSKLPHEAPNMAKFTFETWKNKTALRSKTITIITLTIVGVLATYLVGMDSFDWKSVVDTANGLQYEEIIALGGLVLAWLVRRYGNPTDLSKPKSG
jgi:hypothetical protein